MRPRPLVRRERERRYLLRPKWPDAVIQPPTRVTRRLGVLGQLAPLAEWQLPIGGVGRGAKRESEGAGARLATPERVRMMIAPHYRKD